MSASAPPRATIAYHLMIVALTLFVASAASGLIAIPPYIIADQLQKSVDSKPFAIVLKLPNLLLTLFLLVIILRQLRWPLLDPKHTIWRQICGGVLVALPCALALLGPALAMDYVRWDISIPPYALLWATHNLVLVCLGEELVFRGYLLNGLTRLLSPRKKGIGLALFISSLIFGLTHFRGGAPLILLSTIAGAFYGISFLRYGILGSISTHFSVNAIHFFFFSYPALLLKI